MRIDDLEGKRVFILGGSTGIGAATARAFAAQGARVAIHYNRSAGPANALAAEIGGHALGGDLTETGAAASLVSRAIEVLGGLDILINNAGSLVARVPIADAENALIDDIFDLNARAVIQASQAARAALAQGRDPCIINVGSIAAMDGGGTGAGLYAASKAYIHTLTRHLAKDWAKYGIRVNCVSPGVVDTPFHAATPPERMAAMEASVPMGRIGTPEDITGTFLYFASPSLSGYVTGQTLHVNGGQYMG
ncbi:SDR family NAD(P)-dependent oxidoreductase [Sphingomonas sp.]|jgi:3-oxoacyl-[acyl-carrier protein] reductase|uniref:SDR family NAD(P)-dependent oxidoreductase n=1 Tax=Sphingomonas sp. TaxID=28214 RepID=UPI002ED778F0